LPYDSADSVEKITTQARSISTSLDNPKDFKEFYKWLFDFVKEEGERKTIGMPSSPSDLSSTVDDGAHLFIQNRCSNGHRYVEPHI
jgi:hypothetical protein